MTEPVEDLARSQPVAAKAIATTDWLLTAFLIYFGVIATVITLFILLAWNNGT